MTPSSGAIPGESLLNLRSRPLLTLTILFISAISFVTVFTGETNAATDVRTYRHDLIAQGFSTYLLSTAPATSATLTPRDCTSQSALSGVQAAIWLTKSVDQHLHTPAGPIVEVGAVGGDIRGFLLSTSPTSTTSWSGEQTLLDTASPLAGTGPPHATRLVIASTNPHARPNAVWTATLTALGPAEEGNIRVMVAPPAHAESCAFIVDDTRRTEITRAILGAYPSSSGYTTQWALANADDFPTPQSRYESRPSQYYWLAAAVVLVALWSFVLRIRRPDTTLYALSGLKARHLLLMLGGEAIALTLAGVTLAALVLLLVVRHGDVSSLDVSVGVTALARSLMATLGGVLVVTAATSLLAAWNTFDALRDR